MSEKKLIKLGTTEVEFGGPLFQDLQDSNHIINDPVALHKEMESKGYLYFRNFHDPQEVNEARLAVLEHLHKLGDKLDPKFDWKDGVLLQRCGLGCVPFMEGKNEITAHPAVEKILNGPRPHKFFETFFGNPAITFDYKWLRAMYNEGYTGAHVDNVYMGRGTTQLYTMWVPFGDIPVEMGTLAMLEGSNSQATFDVLQKTYGSMDAEAENLKGTGWFTEDPLELSKFGGVWRTTNFKAGDVLIFGMRTFHMSTVNTTHYVRISCDTRWQSSAEPADPRFVGQAAGHGLEGESKFGVYAQQEKKEVPGVTIDEKKKQWGLI
eukprot:TRINITY_DN1902_c0_g1_i2.p1 TRINITY_DN1902_c0_g1~~TRINITY_DN1902_c0_g1_i2.p1  ORF type:complete len:348 (+),score=131.00 TRINITY_DN1902_c0_g1_i2:82-1044(+)